MAGMSFVSSGFIGGLVDGFKTMKQLQQQQEKIGVQKQALDLQAYNQGVSFNEDGELTPFAPMTAQQKAADEQATMIGGFYQYVNDELGFGNQKNDGMMGLVNNLFGWNK